MGDQKWKGSGPYCWRHYALWKQDQVTPELGLAWGLAVLASEGTMEASKGGRQPTVLHSYAYKPRRRPAGHDNPKDTAPAQ